jgi:Holliday junction resolvasome RuvABC endonuclease subunit
MHQVTIALDLSYHCSGIAVINHAEKTVEIGILPSVYYGFNNDGRINKMLKANINSVSILDILTKTLWRYRHLNPQVIYESMPYKFKRKQTNSDMDLHGMQCHVANSLATYFGCFAIPHMPGEHKRALTGIQKADKALSIKHFLQLYPQCWNWFEKLDDIADAFALLTIRDKHCFPEYEIKKLKLKK